MKKPKSKIKGKTNKIPASFESTDDQTERACVARLAGWVNRIIEEEDLGLGYTDADTKGKDGKYPDMVIYESPRSKRALCVFEFKRPYYDPFNEELKEDAWRKANVRKAPYFCTSNFKTLIWFDTVKANEQRPEEEQILGKYQLSGIEDLNDINQFKYSESIKKALRNFLKELYEVYTGKRPEPKLALDEFLVFRLHEKIELLSTYYKEIIENRFHKDNDFAEELALWFNDQSWNFVAQAHDFLKVARQTAYLLVNKILFYDTLQSRRPSQLDPLEVPESLTKGSLLHATLQNYFNEVLKIDYEEIYDTDFIDKIAFPESKEVVGEIRELINVLRRYKFSTLGYEIIGRIFERLIPAKERHNLGQYFTRSDVVDLILRFCHHHEDDKVLDPACGAGTFLVRAYQHKKFLNSRKAHEAILDTLWGDDIAKFPASLSTINLAINGLEVDKNYPNILNEDFFAIMAGEDGFDPKRWRTKRAKTLNKNEREIVHPRWFDTIVGNPPYTRQEEIAEISPEVAVYKKQLIENALKDPKGKQMASISKQAGIHAYFFVHGTKFLKDGGYFGFIVSNSWLDTRYGAGLQEFFLNNYKIIAIIDSKVERWFADADVNTCIVILQKCKNKKERDANLVRFAYLKRPLAEFIPPVQDMREAPKPRFDTIDKLKQDILNRNELYENDDLRIYPLSQAELWEEGFDSEERKYVGAKWGKYLRAPEIFFKIAEKGKGKLVRLKEIADVRRGFTTGANEFFYLTEEKIKRRKIEKEFWMHKDKDEKWVPNYVIKSPRECKSIVVKPEDLKYRVLMIHKDKKKLAKKKVLYYIKAAERKELHKRPTFKARKPWYDLGKRESYGLLHPMIHHDRQTIAMNPKKVYVDHNLFEIKPRVRKWLKPLLASFLSTWSVMVKEFGGRVNLGEGALKTEGIDIERLVVIHPEIMKKAKPKIQGVIKKLSNRPILSIFKEIGAHSPDEVSLDKVKPDRRALDKLVMGEILGLSEEEQLEVYKAVVDLVKSRIDKAQSVGKNNNYVDGVNVKAAKKSIIDRVDKETQP